MAGCHVNLLLTAEVTTADGTDDNDGDGNAEEEDSMVGQWEQRVRRSSERGLKDWERRRLGLIAVHQGGHFLSTLAFWEQKGQVCIRRAV